MKKILLSFLCLLTMALPSLAAEKNFKWSYDKYTSKATITGSMTKEGTITTGDVKWSFKANANTLIQNYGTDPKGIQLGGKNKQVYSPTDLTLSTDFFKNTTIKKVSFSIYTDDGKGTVTVSCGSDVLSTTSITGTKTTAQTFTWEGVSTCSDLLNINIKQTNGKYAYINNFDITYDDEVVTPPTYQDSCAEPVFTLSTIGELNSSEMSLKATGYAGTEVSVACATKDSKIMWSVAKNSEAETDIEDVKYVIPADAVVGDVYTFTALASVMGKDNKELTSEIVTLELTIAEAPAITEAIFDFENEQSTTYSSWPSGSVTENNQNCTHTINDITLTATGRLTLYEGTAASGISKGWGLRLYKAGTNVNAGKITISAPKGYYITSIKMNTGESTWESFENSDVKVTSKEYVSNTGTITIKNITVKVAKLPAAPAAPSAPDFEGDYSGQTMIAATGNVSLNFKKVEGVTVYYKLNEKEASQGVAPKAEAVGHETQHDGYKAHNGETIEAGTNHASIEFFACDDNTGLHSEVKTVNFDITTGIEDIEAAGNGEAIYFNLQGTRVANPEQGLYIRVVNGKASKVIVK